MKEKLNTSIIIMCFLIVGNLNAQQGINDITFNSFDDGLQGDGFDAVVRTVTLQSDGNLIVGGDFLNFNGASMRYLSRLKPDGTADPSFNLGSGLDGKVYTSILQPDGKIILGGSFTSFNGANAGRLIRLNNNGTRDATFNTTTGVSSSIVYAAALQADGKVVIVGSFSKYNTTTVNRVARILNDGNLDPTFMIGSGPNGLVGEVKIQNDGKIIVAGSFDTFNGVSCNRIVRLNTDGSIDNSFVNGIGFNGNVTALALQLDGNILVGGVFTSYNGTTANRIVRLNSSGIVDGSFISGTGFSDDGVNVIKVAANGSIMVGGSFTKLYNGTGVNRLVLLSSNGVLDPIFDIGSGPATATVYTLENEIDGSWFVGGSFSVFDSQNQGRLAKIDSDGVLDTGYLTPGVGFDNSVYHVISVANNKTIACGSFTRYNGVSSGRIARLLADGTFDSTFNPAGTGANNIVKSGVVQSDNKMVVVGSFTFYNGVAANRIIRITADGAIDPTFVSGTGTNNQIYAIALQSDGRLIVAGNFTSYNGISVNRILRLSANGSIDTTFNIGSGADGIVEAILIQPDGKIVLGGRFSFINGNPYNRIVRLNSDGGIDSSFVIGNGFDKNVYSIAMQSDNKIIVGGTFLNYGTASVKRVLRLNINGSLDASFTTGTSFSNGEVRTILVQQDDRLLLGGTFSGNYNGSPVQRMVRLLSTGIYDTSFSINLNSSLYSICFTPDNKVMIGGNFNSVSGVTKHRVARIKLCTNSSVWDGTLWKNGLPSSEKTIIFNNNFLFLANVNACSCQIAADKTVTVPVGNSMSLVFDYTGLGTLIIEDNASLCQVEDKVLNTGVIQLKRKTTPIDKFDYTYWSSPVLGQTLLAVSPNTLSDKFFSFNSVANDWQQENPLTIMEQGKGYIIRGPENYLTQTGFSTYEASFRGIPNNGIMTSPIGVSGSSNLIGNPYPSALDADSFLIFNKELIDGTLYFWTHNTDIALNTPNPGSGTYAYSSDDYASYNLTGGVATRKASESSIKYGAVNTFIPSGKIASGQSFFTTSIATGTVFFKNSMRVGVDGITGDNSQFFKLKTSLKSNIILEKNRVWLNLSNNQGAFKQTLVGYITGGTDDYERMFDGESFDGNEFVDFYSVCQGKNLVIQGRGLPFNLSDTVQLGYSANFSGLLAIDVDQVDGELVDQSIFLEDKERDIIHNLTLKPYEFLTERGTFNDRFVLRYTDNTLGLTDVEVTLQNQVLVSNKNKEVKVNSSSELIDKVVIYDMSGIQIYKNTNVNNKDVVIRNMQLAKQVLLVKVVLQDGRSITKKVIY
jgi:uncharacterized delta-60 repeat protein